MCIALSIVLLLTPAAYHLLTPAAYHRIVEGSPKASSMQVLVNLLRNAFVKAILPGLRPHAHA